MAGAGDSPATVSLLQPPESPQVIGQPPRMDHPKKTGSSLVHLTDDILVEILSRLPVKSVCRSKCVSRHWRGLISHRAHRKKLPQTLSGFFSRYLRQDDRPRFDSILGGEEQHVSDPSLSFIPGYMTVRPVDCCNGLLLCLCSSKDLPNNECNYVVCNPATEKWQTLPDSGHHNEAFATRLCFDPAISSRLYSSEAGEWSREVYSWRYYCVTDVEVYSSEAGEWSREEHGWSDELLMYDRSVFLDGMLYFIAYDKALLTVDGEGKPWNIIPLLETMTVWVHPDSNEALIGQSQGRLHYLNVRDRDPSTLSVWILDSYHSGEWIFKYNISTSKLFGRKDLMFAEGYTLIAIHPECNLVFIVLHGDKLLLAYDMDRGKVHVIRNLVDPFYEALTPYLPYVPLLTETESLTNHQ